MKAVIAMGPDDYQLVENHPTPALGDGEVLVKVLATGICKYYLKILIYRSFPFFVSLFFLFYLLN